MPEVTIKFTSDERDDASRALAANALTSVLWTLRDELHRAARGKTERPEGIGPGWGHAAEYWAERLGDELASEGIDLEALWQ